MLYALDACCAVPELASHVACACSSALIESRDLPSLLQLRLRLVKIALRDQLVAANASAGKQRHRQRSADRPVLARLVPLWEDVRREVQPLVTGRDLNRWQPLSTRRE